MYHVLEVQMEHVICSILDVELCFLFRRWQRKGGEDYLFQPPHLNGIVTFTRNLFVHKLNDDIETLAVLLISTSLSLGLESLMVGSLEVLQFLIQGIIVRWLRCLLLWNCGVNNAPPHYWFYILEFEVRANFLTQLSCKVFWQIFSLGYPVRYVQAIRRTLEQKWLNELVPSKCIMIMHITRWCHAFVLTFCNLSSLGWLHYWTSYCKTNLESRQLYCIFHVVKDKILLFLV